MSSVLPFTDIIFGNETEAAAYAEVNSLGTTEVAEIALKLAMLPKENGSKSRLVIITQGEGENIAANKPQFLFLSTQDPWWLWNTAMLKASLWKVKRRKNPEISANICSAALEKSDIVDTNGAGDAFVGGFLAQWVLGNVSGRLILSVSPH